MRPKDVHIQKRIAEFALWIVVPKELLEVGQSLVERSHMARRHRKELAPMGASA